MCLVAAHRAWMYSGSRPVSSHPHGAPLEQILGCTSPLFFFWNSVWGEFSFLMATWIRLTPISLGCFGKSLCTVILMGSQESRWRGMCAWVPVLSLVYLWTLIATSVPPQHLRKSGALEALRPGCESGRSECHEGGGSQAQEDVWVLSAWNLQWFLFSDFELGRSPNYRS